ncbi:hypothetical protein ABPG75_003265 [Micractinium tetrahymenae]
MGSVDRVLGELHAGGYTALAGEVQGLRPQKNEPTPGVLRLQRRYARVPSNPLTAAFKDQVVVSTALPPPAGTVQVAVTFDIVQAPSAFSLPVMQKRPWDPPFQVRMTWRSSLPLQFNTTVAAFVADEAAVPSMLTWQPPGTGDAAKALLDHQQERMVVLAPVAPEDGISSPTSSAAGAGGGMLQDPQHYAEVVFTFQRLSFGGPSQMRPRWLVFAASLLGGGCVYSHYLVPTVVMSRLADQFEKAKAVLWGGQQPEACDSSVMKMDYRQLRKHIKRELSAVGIAREPSEEDYRYLATRAGFVASATGVRGTSASLQELAAFKEWFGGHVIMLKHIRAHYERTEPQVVCGFGVTREQADAMLAPHPVGTFLLRFGSQGGQLVLSVRSAGGHSTITHFCIPTAALQSNGLEAVLERNGTAEQLLDAATGQRHLRTAVLDRSYLQAVDMAEVRKRYRRPEGNRSDKSDEAESSPSAPEPPHSLAAYQQQSANLGATLGMPPPQPPGKAWEPLLGCGVSAMRGPSQPLLRQHAGAEYSGASAGHLAALQAQQQHRQQQQQAQQQARQAGGMLPSSQALAGSVHGGTAAAPAIAAQSQAGDIAGTAGGAFNMHLPACQVPPAAAAAHNPYSAAGLLQQPTSAAAAAAYASLHAWPTAAAAMAAPPPPAAAPQLSAAQQLEPAALQPLTGQHQHQQQYQQQYQPPQQAAFSWSSPGLAPLLGMTGGLQAAPQWAPLTLPPAGLVAAAAGTFSHHSTPPASLASPSGTDGTPSIGPGCGPAAAAGLQGQEAHSQGTQPSRGSGSAAGSEGGGRPAEHAPPLAQLSGSAGMQLGMHQQFAGFPCSGGPLPPPQHCWVQAGSGAARGDALPPWLRDLQLGGGAGSGMLPADSGSGFLRAGTEQLVVGSAAAKQEDLLMDFLS